MKMLKFTVLLGAFALCATAALADTLYLKTGKKMEGKVVKKTDSGITFSFAGGQIDFNHGEIDRIEKSETPTPVTSAPRKTKKTSVTQEPKKGFKEKIEELKEQVFGGKDEKKSSGKAGGLSVPVWFAVNFFSCFLIAGLVMKAYFLVFGEHVPYLTTLWFQIKVFLVGMLAGGLVAMGIAFGVAASGGDRNSAQFIAIIGFLAAYAASYYIIAKKTFDAGFIMAFGLAVVMSLSNLAVGRALMELGLEPTQREFASYLKAFDK